jgi:hypothetical protein
MTTAMTMQHICFRRRWFHNLAMVISCCSTLKIDLEWPGFVKDNSVDAPKSQVLFYIDGISLGLDNVLALLLHKDGEL